MHLHLNVCFSSFSLVHIVIAQIEWLNNYHKQVLINTSPLLSDDSNILEWLERETQPISKRKKDCKEKSPQSN